MVKINLRCPGCGVKQVVDRVDYDPANATTAIVGCDECVGGDFGETRYEDDAGNEVLWQPTEEPKT